MKRFYRLMLVSLGICATGCLLNGHGYQKICFRNERFNTPFSHKEMNFKKAKYIYTDQNGNRRCFCFFNQIDGKKLNKSLSEYSRGTLVTDRLVKHFKSKRRDHDQMVGNVLQDFLDRDKQLSDSSLTIKEIWDELKLDQY